VSLEFQILLGGDPIYKQIVDQVRRAAATGHLQSGDPLPSIRTLAERLVINPNTVARAYRDLVTEGTIEARQGIGYVVAERRQILSDAERRRRLDQALDPLAQEALVLDLDTAEIMDALEKKLSALRNPKLRRRNT
jgi:GntR family transcriptional regulator